jgi:putative selenium metabolism protein SsnA
LEKQILIKNVTVIQDPLIPEITPGTSIVIVDDLIRAVGLTNDLLKLFPEASQVDGQGCLLLPGLIDAHTHFYSALTTCMPFKGESPRVFHEVLTNLWWKFDKALILEEEIALSVLAGCIASLKSGITSVFDHHSSPLNIPDCLDVIAANTRKCGLRACLAYETSDRDGVETCNQAIRENIRFIKSAQKQKDSMIQGLFGLHAVYSLSDETLKRCVAESSGLETGFHMHMSEHKREIVQFKQTHNQSIPEFLAEIGILQSQTILAHTVHIDTNDIGILKSTNSFNVHNPHSNISNGVGIAPLCDMARLDQPVGLGSDGFYDLPQEMVYAKLLQNLASGNPSAFSDQMALSLVYDHNVRFAENIFHCKLGKIKPGYKADLIFIAYEPFTPIEVNNLTSHIFTAITTGTVRKVFIDGHLVLQDGYPVHFDEAQIRAQARKVAQNIWKRM